jgi:integrase
MENLSFPVNCFAGLIPRSPQNFDPFSVPVQDVKAPFDLPESLYPSFKKGIRFKQVSNSFDRAVRDLKFNDGVFDHRQRVCFHTFRHIFASWLVEAGTDLYTVKELMGHGTLTMTERYSHLSENTCRAAVRNLEKAVSESKPMVVALQKK